MSTIEPHRIEPHRIEPHRIEPHRIEPQRTDAVSPKTARYNTEVAAAAAAADAARGTPGVVRLQPRLWGLVQQLSREMWERATGTHYPDIAGVEATLAADGTAVDIDISMVLHSSHNATTVSAAVQASVRIAVTAATGLAVGSVTTHITDIDLAPLLA